MKRIFPDAFERGSSPEKRCIVISLAVFAVMLIFDQPEIIYFQTAVKFCGGSFQTAPPENHFGIVRIVRVGMQQQMYRQSLADSDFCIFQNIMS